MPPRFGLEVRKGKKMKENKQTPKEAEQAGSFRHWEYVYHAGQWIPVEKKQAEVTLLGARA